MRKSRKKFTITIKVKSVEMMKQFIAKRIVPLQENTPMQISA
jgi:hypothetical protein